MRALYFDCFAGASGDMIVGALLNLGLELETLKRELSSLALKNYEISASPVKRSRIAATKFEVRTSPAPQPARHLSDIRALINNSSLSDRVKQTSVNAFERLAEAEARVHGTTIDKVHFHEVGAVDSIIDIVGAMIGFDVLGVERFFSSPLRLGHGSIRTEHGLMPIPAPATAELLRGVPVYAGELEGEFVTPTGAAIIVSLCEEFIPLPPVAISHTGYGAGSRDPEGFPNAMRLILGDMAEEESLGARSLGSFERVTVIETNIDDMNPQVYGYVIERAFALGAIDAFLTPVQMKKDRPGTLLTILCGPEKRDTLIDMLLAETSTLGVRYYEANRRVLDRAIEEVETRYGRVRIKVAQQHSRTLHFHPEYEDCLRLARQAGVPLIEVQTAAAAAYRINTPTVREGIFEESDRTDVEA
ncbi:MAG: nickel pincer cofactor biosynthesis protein LarC [Blastocatellia bacterium]|nr:nickel pincer cofactor biosynthesis protein LarC [Blastocatellia bacterium]